MVIGLGGWKADIIRAIDCCLIFFLSGIIFYTKFVWEVIGYGKGICIVTDEWQEA